MWHQPARFENSWPPFCQIWIIFTHLKLWIASARHNFKWVEKFNNLAVKGLSPHDALRHYITSLKTELIILQLRVLEWKFPWNLLIDTLQFSTTSNHLHPLRVENYDSNSRLVVDKDGNGKFRFERVNFFNNRFNPLTTGPGYITFLHVSFSTC